VANKWALAMFWTTVFSAETVNVADLNPVQEFHNVFTMFSQCFHKALKCPNTEMAANFMYCVRFERDFIFKVQS